MQEDFHHALKFKYDLCIGCAHCTGACPTGAIHVDDGHPRLDPNRCVDCGRCYIACPVNAIYIEQDDFQTVYDCKYPVLLMPSIFMAQFEDKIKEKTILSALYHIGFKHVFECEKSVDFLRDEMQKATNENDGLKPLISTFCPAIVRLIQVKFPVLVPNLYLMKPPLDLTALYIRKLLTEEDHIPAEDIGIFYVTPCAAKIAAIKSPATEEESPVTKVINMNFLYSKVMRVIKQGEYQLCDDARTRFHRLSKSSLNYTLTGGEANLLKEGRNLAIDGIHNVSEFLEKLEDEDIQDIDFLELRACDESCSGGILTANNRFLMTERQRKRMQKSPDEVDAEDNDLLNYTDYLAQHKRVLGHVEPRSMDKMDDDLATAMQKMKRAFEINLNLPQVDCRICGYQSCKSLSEAVVKGDAEVDQCIFIQRILEHCDKMDISESMKVMTKIWGTKKTSSSIAKNLNL
ncbi:MAG: 4Fe-4S binding protein [Bacteroidales bacterium]|nr:4Fe-4S binding protein [Bacteroidales bacterium]MBO7646788.1 4Fe-4S binding protein [Bacteroidales bacterium]